MLPGDLNALPVVGDRLVEVSEFAVNPTDAVGHPSEDDAVAVALGHLQSLAQSLKRLRHPSLVTQSEAKEETALKQCEPVAQFRRQLQCFPYERLGALILGLEEMHYPAINQPADQRGLVV